MKLLVETDSCNPRELIAMFDLSKQFHCKYDSCGRKVTFTKNPQLTDDEFSLFAGKLVMLGFNVVCQEVAEFNQRVEQAKREHRENRQRMEQLAKELFLERGW